ncbi:hypothetical protein C8R45DRAFT_1045884 [Mycena sanguinolenta]|nr:hypothetical protein C8R45DRAFT_1045884 [Mycena sanguinolenta]
MWQPGGWGVSTALSACLLPESSFVDGVLPQLTACERMNTFMTQLKRPPSTLSPDNGPCPRIHSQGRYLGDGSPTH